MSPLALGLVLAAACCHATWNLLAKGAKDTVAFTWLFTACSVVLYLPLAAGMMVWARPDLDAGKAGLVLVSAGLQIVYFLLLGWGYRAGDLSLVYPLARGTGPLLATAGAMLLFGERPSALALAGAGLVVGGMLMMTAPRRLSQARGSGRAVAFALATGACIATYTLWDKRVVAVVPPVILNYGMDLVRTLALAPVALRTPARRAAVLAEWRAQPRNVIGVAVLAPLAYLFVLTALTMSPVSYVAPAREVSILLGAILGARLLREGDATRRLAGAAAIGAGVIALALG